MEQSSTMDKKPQSRPPLLCKNNQEPSKSDYSTKKNGSQFPRKRENEKSDNGKRSSANRGGRAGQRYVRPREKVGGQVDSEESLSEFGSVQRSGGKKQNITHLMNNWWPAGPDRHSNEHHHGVRGYRSRKHHVHPVRYNKEHYLQANCQFIVAAGHDYSLYENDPDHLVDWKCVEEVRLHVSESPACPICLHPPVAPKVTRCGHIYCFSCILHYLSLSDKDWRKCPICFDAITKVDLKSVATILHKYFTSSQEIELKLMRRERDSLVPVPASSFSPGSTKHLATLSSSEALLSYSKLIVASKSEVNEHIVKRELAALECLLEMEGDQPEACFIEEALALVSSRESSLSSLFSTTNHENPHLPLPEGGASSPHPPPDTDVISEGFGRMSVKEEEEEEEEEGKTRLSKGGVLASLGLCPLSSSPPTMTMQGREEEALVNIHPDDLDIGQLQTNVTNQDMKSTAKSTFYFYQESSGAQVYLHALNVHMLVKEFGSLENCPHTIKAKVLEKESDSMSETLRQRLRYLRHLPIACPFEVVEVEVKPPLVSQLIIAEFQGQLESRERKRKKRAKEEHRIEKRVRVVEDRIMGRSRGKAYKMSSSYKHFPNMAEESTRPVQQNVEDDLVSLSSVGSPPSDDTSNTSTISFAQIIQHGNKKSPIDQMQEPFPSLASGNRNVSLHHPMTHQGGMGSSVRSADSDEEEEGERVPDFKNAFSDAFAKALDQACMKTVAESTLEDVSSQRGQRGKKKKKKGIVLLSSGGR